jgi:hypothetical protein
LTFVHKKKIIEKKGEKLYIVGDRKGAWVKGLSDDIMQISLSKNCPLYALF